MRLGATGRRLGGVMPAIAARQLANKGRDVPCSDAQTGPRVLLAMAHPTMRALTCELLRREGGCRVRGVTGHDEALAHAVDQEYPDLVVLDAAQFPRCCPEALRRFPPERMIVIGPEPGNPYRAAALAAGAGGWVSRERIGDELVTEVWRVLGGFQLPPPGPDPGGGDRSGSVVDRKSPPRPARMAAAAAAATLTKTPRAPEGT